MPKETFETNNGECLEMDEYEKRIREFTVSDLQKCYVLFDTYWDDGLNDEKTLRKLKSMLLGENLCEKCHQVLSKDIEQNDRSVKE